MTLTTESKGRPMKPALIKRSTQRPATRPPRKTMSDRIAELEAEVAALREAAWAEHGTRIGMEMILGDSWGKLLKDVSEIKKAVGHGQEKK